jgi:hypothetical protein
MKRLIILFLLLCGVCFGRVAKNIALIDDFDSGKIKIMDESGNLLETITRTEAKDNISWDGVNNQFWLNDEDPLAGTDNKIYKLNDHTDLLDTFSIATANYDLEGICYDPSDNTLWTVNDHNHEGDAQTLENRSVADGSVIGAAIDISATIEGPQGVAYDTSDDTLWITDNTDLGSGWGAIYNVTKAGTIASTIIISDAISSDIVDERVQGIEYDARDDSLWFTMRNNKIYNITKAGVLQKKLDSPFTTTAPDQGPTGITLIPTWVREVPHDPVLSLRLYDDAADTTVAAQAGSTAALVGGDNTSVKSATGVVNKAFDLNGTDDYVNFGDVTLPATGYAIAMWINPDSVTSRVLLGADNDDWLRINTATTMTIKASATTSNIGPVSFSTGVDQFVVFQKIGATSIEVWVNGVLQLTDGVSNDAFVPSFIGQKDSSGFFDGKMSNVLLYDHILGTREIAYLYNDGKGNDNLATQEVDVITISGGYRSRYNGGGR